MNTHSSDVRTLEQARHWFEARGVSVSDWAKENGFPRDVVYAILAGRTRGRRGRAHQVAVALGIKPAPPAPVELGAVEAKVKTDSENSSKENVMPP